MMRSVCFVDRLELEFSGNHFSHAITLGDVDNDGVNELLIGNVDGVFAIFKGDQSTKPWKKCSELGTVTCVGVGDICNCGHNAAVVINAEAKCFIFNIEAADRSLPQSPLATPTTPPPFSRSMKPQYKQSLQVPNTKAMCLAKITSNGRCAMYLGHTDREVAVYHWNSDSSRLDLIKKFSLTGQIGSLSVGQSSDGLPQVLLSQPGGTYIPISCPQGRETEGKLTCEDLCLGDVIGQAQRRNPTSSTEVVGQIRQSRGSGEVTAGGGDNIVALCTLDGVVRLLKDEHKQWELQVDHSLFSVGKLDITGNGSDEIVVCAWDGTTYIVDQTRNCVRFWFDQNVSAFTCGYYGVSDGRQVPCLVYTTFTNVIYLYREVTLPTVPASNLLLTLQNTPIPSKLEEEFNSMDCKINVDTSKKKQQLLQCCLYGQEDPERRRKDHCSQEKACTGFQNRVHHEINLH